MKSVGVREFRDRATKYLSGDEPIAVQKRGRVVGIYTPVKRDPVRVEKLFAQLDANNQNLLSRSGLSEDEFADLFDLNKPLPE